MNVVEHPVVNFQEIPQCLRVLADRIEAGRFGPIQNVTVVVAGPGDVHPAIRCFGDFDAISTVGILQAAVHDILTCNTPVRTQMEKL